MNAVQFWTYLVIELVLAYIIYHGLTEGMEAPFFPLEYKKNPDREKRQNTPMVPLKPRHAKRILAAIIALAAPLVLYAIIVIVGTLLGLD